MLQDGPTCIDRWGFCVDMTEKKTGKITEMVSPRSGAKVPTGAHKKNTGGKKGRSGRKPKETLDFLRAGSERPKARKAFNDRLDDGDLKAWDLVLRYTERPVSRMEHTGADGGPITTESPTDWLRDELARIAERQRKGEAAREANASTG